MKTALLLVLALLGPAAAAQSWREALPQAALQGQGDFTWLGWRVYTARLWSAGPLRDDGTPFALQLTYHRSISRSRLVDTSLDEMQRLAARPVDAATLGRWRSQLEQAFIDVAPGDELTGVYLPGYGCRFYARDRRLAGIADPEFARAFFRIWLAPDSRDAGLRRQLLGLQP
ncbi:chalcone isomerase family protein [Jeongeupia naejangsanensis]|uniref:Chalcone isomerase family protein n=1 Tax=Jeongeupia naejangsanensis TaxID=613195 RepID=A0ABS2BQM9_9NEIS|nr:chalcone isomerase family protein [Jeongeupia naejangsanensis]MBM3117261.1 chalcone isomerase family protein [Jeongeupia naejangsanensis]